MARIETLTAYRCAFNYLKRNNPLREELREIIKSGVPPEYTFDDFIKDYCKFTSSLAIGKITERAILLPEDNIYQRENKNGIKKWRIVPYAGKQGNHFVLSKQVQVRNIILIQIVRLYMNIIFLYIKVRILQ